MSTTSPARQARTPRRHATSFVADAPQRVLRLVAPARTRAARTPFVIVVLGVLGVGLVGLIFMSTVMQQQAFELSRLDSAASTLDDREAALRTQLTSMQSPADVARRAERLGMVPNENPVFLRLSDGEVVGKARPASADGDR